MRSAVLAVVLAFVAVKAQAVELKYKWKKGGTYRFQTSVQDHVTLKAMGMNTDDTYTTTSRFSLVIDKVKPTGEASGNIVIEQFETKDPSGKVLAGIDKLPKNALKNRVEIDAKGHFEFKEIVYLLVDESGETRLVGGKASATGASATAQAGDEKVTLYAEFDPKTGAVKAGYKVEKMAASKKKIAVEEKAQNVDLLPRQFLEMLALPDGDLQQGQSSELALYGNTITTKVEEVTATAVRLAYGIKTDMNTQKTANDASKNPGAMMPGGMPGGMPGMPGMEMPAGGMGGDDEGTNQAALAATNSSMKADGDFKASFDLVKGMISSIDGTISTKVSQSGMMDVSNTSVVSMKYVP